MLEDNAFVLKQSQKFSLVMIVLIIVNASRKTDDLTHGLKSPQYCVQRFACVEAEEEVRRRSQGTLIEQL
ncbi:unnamed protein product [Calypogeia fissa]